MTKILLKVFVVLLFCNQVMASDPGKEETQQVVADPWGGDTYLRIGKDKQALQTVSDFGPSPSKKFSLPKIW